MNNIEPGYEKLAEVLQMALDQAQAGKGKQRHANDLPFDQQPILQLGRMVGGLKFQAMKKIQESERMSADPAVRELLGAIVYCAAEVIRITE